MSKPNETEKSGAADLSPSAEDDINPVLPARRTIRYDDDDVERQQLARKRPTEFGHPLTRSDSTYSIHSIRSFRSGGRTIDPALAFPVTYRTVSFNISATQEKAIQDAKGAKDKAKDRESPQHLIHETVI
jgi:hypothetical protein